MALIVPQALVKNVKDSLEAHGKLDKQWKIRPYRNHPDCNTSDENNEAPRYFVPTTAFSELPHGVSLEGVLKRLLADIGLENHSQDIDLEAHEPLHVVPSVPRNRPHSSNKLASTVYNWLRSVPLSMLPVAIDDLVFAARWPYLIYPPLLLLPATTFQAAPWPDLMPRLDKALLDDLYASMCAAFNTTHLALDAPIPSLSGSNPNILRSPTNLTPLYGDFSSAPPSMTEHVPTAGDFENAFWCSTSQNGISQTWAPRYTMFSRGNLSEKKRVLELPSLTRDGLGGKVPGEISAVDLYAGIGYFAFSYMKAGVGKVLCWELNPWSIEGMRRGAERNGWKFRKVEDREDVIDSQIGEGAESSGNEQELVVFHEDNEGAIARISRMREIANDFSPIRHVNCGLLPTSEGSWKTAVQILDPQEGGWIHAHENVKVREVEQRKHELIGKFTELTHHYHGTRRFSIECSHIETVKSYGPGVSHVVFDIAIFRLEPP